MLFSYLCIPSFVELRLLFLGLCLSLLSLPVCHGTRRILHFLKRSPFEYKLLLFFFLFFNVRKFNTTSGLTKLEFLPLLIEFPVPLCFSLLGLANFVVGSLKATGNLILKTRRGPSGRVNVSTCLKAHLGGGVSQNFQSLGQLVEELRWEKGRQK